MKSLSLYWRAYPRFRAITLTELYTRNLPAVTRNITNRGFRLPLHVNAKSKQILHRAFFITTSQGHVDRFEIKPRRSDLVEIFDGAVIRVDGEVVPGVN
jgi:hypothetical protein